MDERSVLDRSEHRIVVITFRIGLVLSFAVFVIGLLAWVVSGSPEVGAVDLARLDDLSNPATWMGIGIIALAATPVLNVLALLLLWIGRRQIRLALIAAAVLSMVVVAIVLGRM